MFNFVYNGIDFSHKIDNSSLPAEDFRKHLHPFCEIIYFVRGNVRYTVEAETRQLSEGDIIFIPPGKAHFATVDLSVPYERYVFKISEKIIPEYIRKKMTAKTAFYADQKKYGVFFGQYELYINKYSKEELYIIFLCETVKMLVMLFREPASSASSIHSEFIESIVNYIDENIRKKITVQMLTNEFHYSKSFLNIEFKRQMKIPLMKYIRYKKIIAAHQMIINGTKKTDAAEMMGFDDYSTFYRAYKKLVEGAFETSD